MRDLALKIDKLRDQDKETRGMIQQHLDRIEIRTRDRQQVTFKLK